jgi:hypothetical protein
MYVRAFIVCVSRKMRWTVQCSGAHIIIITQARNVQLEHLSKLKFLSATAEQSDCVINDVSFFLRTTSLEIIV